MTMHKFSFLVSDRIRLRALEPEDLDLLYSLENDPASWNMSNSTMPYSKFFLHQYLEHQQGDIFADKQLRLVIESIDKEVIGLVDLFEFQPLHQRAELGIIILKEYRKQGYAVDAINLLLDYAFNHLMLHQVYAQVGELNQDSIKLFQACGFTHESTLKQWLFTPDGFKDAFVFQKIKSI